MSTVATSLNEIQRRNNEIRSLRKEYTTEALREVPPEDIEGTDEKNKSLKKKRAELFLAYAGSDKDVNYLVVGINTLAEKLLEAKGVVRPVRPENYKALTDAERKPWQEANTKHLKAISDEVDNVLSQVYVGMKEEDRPFGGVMLADGSTQKTVDGAIVEAVAEKAKGTKPGKVKVSKIDDGSEAEKASEVAVTGIIDTGKSSTSGAKTDTTKSDKKTKDTAGGASSEGKPESTESATKGKPSADSVNTKKAKEKDGAGTVEADSSGDEGKSTPLAGSVSDQSTQDGGTSAKPSKPPLNVVPKEKKLKAVK